MRVYSAFAKHNENHSREGVFIGDETHADFHKTFASIFSAYTTSILKILRNQSDKIGIKWIVFETKARIASVLNSSFIS